MSVVQEAYVNGVSTRKVDRLVEQMGPRGLSKDRVSRMCAGLDENREHKLEHKTRPSRRNRAVSRLF